MPIRERQMAMWRELQRIAWAYCTCSDGLRCDALKRIIGRLHNVYKAEISATN